MSGTGYNDQFASPGFGKVPRPFKRYIRIVVTGHNNSRKGNRIQRHWLEATWSDGIAWRVGVARADEKGSAGKLSSIAAPPRDQGAGGTVSDENRRSCLGGNSPFEHTGPVIKQRSFPIGLVDSMHFGVECFPSRLPMHWSGIIESGKD